MDVLPRILDHGRILMFFNLTLSDLLSLDPVNFSSGGSEEKEGNSSYIQNPVIETRGFTQEVAMKSGETLILAGYERVEDKTDKQGVGKPDNMLTGGSSSADRDRTVLVIMLTPVVLESPLTPESRMND
jgi:type II secretory pathway component GspD/PulD (secretin)